jgi:hypothetical protein
MISATGAANLSSAQKAEAIYVQARSEMASRLWRAALGVDDEAARPGSAEKSLPMSLESLLALLEERQTEAPRPLAPPPPRPDNPPASDHGAHRTTYRDEREAEATFADGSGGTSQFSGSGRGYGPNAGYVGMLGAAAKRTGLPAAALATIVHAEAAKGPDGRWLPYSRNPRSSAAGLGQFLSSTWRGEAERNGTWLNEVAQQRGWLNEHGKVRGDSRAALLALRYDPEASIQATADYAVGNLRGLRQAGVQVGDDAQSIARAAYLGHHLGRGDAIRFLKGGLDSDRAQTLLRAQIGSAGASRRIAASDSATAAHRTWLLDYIGRNINANRFMA